MDATAVVVAVCTMLVSTVGLGLTSIIRGWLVPGRTVDRLAEQWREALADSRRREAEWREVALHGVRQVDALVDAGRTTVAVVDSVRTAAIERKGSEG